ncbi:MAG: hypothetical protein H0V64_03795 [Geodermatophilaceae bacterium]|nr:hypothetical protein [Geodermatophilaceae bacterium]MDQ3464594.1 hypothetical protein [Actinomycetota bacterium]
MSTSNRVGRQRAGRDCREPGFGVGAARGISAEQVRRQHDGQQHEQADERTALPGPAYCHVVTIGTLRYPSAVRPR